MCSLDKYIIIEKRNGVTWTVMPEDYDDVKRAVKSYNETSDEYGEGKDELLELRGISGAPVCILASAIDTFSMTSVESRARSTIIEERYAADTEEAKNRILREEGILRAVTG